MNCSTRVNDALDRLTAASAPNGPVPYTQSFGYSPTGNMTTKNTTTFTYGSSAHVHAVTSLTTGESYTYDANGNMTCRVEDGNTYKQDYNIENRLTAVSRMSGGCGGTVLETTGFAYDGDGNLVKKINPDGSRTLYIGCVYEVDKSSSGNVTATRNYYPLAGAMRINSTLYFIRKDHLGSASAVTDASGNIVGKQLYYPFGGARYVSGTMYTDRLYTGQREITGLGIYHYNARFYSPSINRFLSADTIVPGYANPQNLNRYSYVLNNPLRYTDPSGHICLDPVTLVACVAVVVIIALIVDAAFNGEQNQGDVPMMPVPTQRPLGLVVVTNTPTLLPTLPPTPSSTNCPIPMKCSWTPTPRPYGPLPLSTDTPMNTSTPTVITPNTLVPSSTPTGTSTPSPIATPSFPILIPALPNHGTLPIPI